MANDKKPLLRVEGLKKYFPVSNGVVNKVVDGVSFEVYPKETFGLVGGSGSGKSTIVKCIIRLLNPTDGKIYFEDADISGNMDENTEKMLRTDMQMIFQDPLASLNTKKKIGDIIGEGLDIHHSYIDANDRKKKIEDMLVKVGLNPIYYDRYPEQFSGGQRQRVGIARALIMNPKLIIADECISALDVSIQAQIVNLLLEVQKTTDTAILFIAHDLAMVKYISDRVAVLEKGKLVEIGNTKDIFENPKHQFTKELIEMIPSINPVLEKKKRRPVGTIDRTKI